MVGVLCFLLGITFLLAGVMGLVIALFANFIGLLPPLVGVRRVHLMGSEDKDCRYSYYDSLPSTREDISPSNVTLGLLDFHDPSGRKDECNLV